MDNKLNINYFIFFFIPGIILSFGDITLFFFIPEIILSLDDITFNHLIDGSVSEIVLDILTYLIYFLGYVVLWISEPLKNKDIKMAKKNLLWASIGFCILSLVRFIEPNFVFIFSSLLLYGLYRGILINNWKKALAGWVIGYAYSVGITLLYLMIFEYSEYPLSPFLILIFKPIIIVLYFYTLFIIDNYSDLKSFYKNTKFHVVASDFVFLYLTLFSMLYLIIFGIRNLINMYTSELINDLYILFGACILCVIVTALLSNIIKVRLFTVRRYVAWNYLLSFLPVLNLIPLIKLTFGAARKPYSHNLETKIEEETTTIIKNTLVVINVAALIISFASYLISNEPLLLGAFISMFVSVTFLIILYNYRKGIWLLVINAIVSSVCLYYFNLWGLVETANYLITSFIGCIIIFNVFHPEKCDYSPPLKTT